MEGNFSLSDIAAAVRGEGGMGSGGLVWIFAIVILFALLGGGGGILGNNSTRAATTEDLASGFNFNALQNKGNEILAAISGVNQNLGNAICSLSYELVNQFRSLENILNNCCCQMLRAVDGVNYNIGQSTSQIMQAQERSTQRILDYLCNQETQRLRDENFRSYVASLFCGVPRYLPGTVYGSTQAPFFVPQSNQVSCCQQFN